MPHKVLAFVGSLRKGSINRVLFNAAIELAPPDLAITEFTRLGELALYNADLDGEAKPEPVAALLDAMRQADAFLFVSPEYNYSVPGVLKNAIDWASRGGPKSPPSRTSHGHLGKSRKIFERKSGQPIFKRSKRKQKP